MHKDKLTSEILGLERGTVKLSHHREEWHHLFEIERDSLLQVLPIQAAVEHIGSTAICGISAKPILDLMIGIFPFQKDLIFVREIEKLGYEYKGENGIPNRHFFGKGVPRTVHLNVVCFGGDFWLSHLTFREYLKHSRDAALEYERLKLSLAERFANDREQYTNGKVAFVDKILMAAGRK